MDSPNVVAEGVVLRKGRVGAHPWDRSISEITSESAARALRVSRVPKHHDRAIRPDRGHSLLRGVDGARDCVDEVGAETGGGREILRPTRSEEHTSELQSRSDLVCRLLLE